MNCRSILPLLSAYLDRELTGDESLMVRGHVYSCKHCHEELLSLQVVKRLLGSLESAEASDDWSSNVTAVAYAGSRPWWEKKITLDPVSVAIGVVTGHGLSPRGVRLARSLALSTVFVLLAASPFARHERLDHGVTGRITASMGVPMFLWASHPETASNVNSALQGFLDRPMDVEPSDSVNYRSEDLRKVSDLLREPDQSFANANELTLTVSGGR